MKADREIRAKSRQQIHADTARTWAARAVAYCQRALKEADPRRLKELWHGYDTSRDEALEHAALAEDRGKTVGKIQRLLDAAKRPKRRR